jgi:ABC exporter DevB family membrane fusion protein
MKRTLFVIVPLVAMTLGFVTWNNTAAQPVAAGSDTKTVAHRGLVAGPGRVEPLSEEIKVGAQLAGKIKYVRVEEGDHVRKGQIVAILEFDDAMAQCASAEAELQQKQADLRKVLNGARDMERREAAAAVKEAEAVLANATAEVKRREGLFKDGVIARDATDLAVREYDVAKARLDAAKQHFAFIDEQAREEDRAKAEADVALSRAKVEAARAEWEKHFVRAPITGVILRKHVRAGETVSDMRDTPVITLADASVLRVRMDVDENDVGRIHVGQSAYVTAEAYPGRKFPGKVVRVGQLLGRKNVRTDEPTEKVDTKILETLIQLDPGAPLPLGLRVDAFLLAK